MYCEGKQFETNQIKEEVNLQREERKMLTLKS